jgi:hypothetical protein
VDGHERQGLRVDLLSGGGLGGNLGALVPPYLRSKIAETLRSNGAVNVIQTEVAP